MVSLLTTYVLSIVILFAQNACASDLASSQTRDEPRKITNPYLQHLFYTYGDQGTISFEGLEHLMHSLGLGGLQLEHAIEKHRPEGYQVPDFLSRVSIDDYRSQNDELDDNPIKYLETLDTKNPEEFFHNIHDTHRHLWHRGHETSDPFGKSCLSPLNLIKIYDPKALNGSTSKQSHIYHSSIAPENASTDQNQNESTKRKDPEDTEASLDDLSNIKITPNTFMNMCPALLVQLEQRSCRDDEEISARSQNEHNHAHDEGHKDEHDDDDHGHHNHKNDKPKQPISAYAWIAAFVSVTIISLCGLVGIGMVPLTRFAAYHEILRFMIAIAIGTLCGDALMHLLPHALIPHDNHSSSTDNHSKHGSNESGHNHNTEAVWLFGCAFFTALVMYAIESLLPLTGETGHGHSHSHQLPEKTSHNNSVQAHCHQSSEHIDRSNNCGSFEELDNDLESSKKNNEENIMVKDTKNKIRPALTPVAFMVVIGDGLHNLTDGMAIGAAFGVDPVTGMATALAVLCHELPHELGDFALLLQTGVSLRRAIFLNIVSSVLSFVGMVVGLLIVGVDTSFVRWIYSGTAGTFLYIALADLVPELNRGRLTFKMVIIQTLGILIGGIIMLLIGLYEDDLRVLFE